MLVIDISICGFQSMVQVETLGELGVFFTLFVVGLEFSPERLRKVNKRFEFRVHCLGPGAYCLMHYGRIVSVCRCGRHQFRGRAI